MTSRRKGSRGSTKAQQLELLASNRGGISRGGDIRAPERDIRPAPVRKSGAARRDVVWLAWPCVVLAVDTARRSGWAIRVRGKLTWSGELDTLDGAELAHVVELAAFAAKRCDVPLVLVLERAWGGRVNVIVGLGMARERWLAAWRLAAQPRKRVVSVMPATWRARVLGRAGRGQRDEIRAYEMLAAKQELVDTNIGPDEAAAILISRWAAHTLRVGEVLPKRMQARSFVRAVRP